MYKRVLLKLSGEALAGEKGYGVDNDVLTQIATEVKEVVANGVEVAVVIGGGNIFRGIAGASSGFDRATADNVGMLATMMNSILFSEKLNSLGCGAVVMSAFEANKISEYYTVSKALEYLGQKKVVVIGGGTGNPFFTTDTAAALRCAETKCQVFFKATKVDGIYTSDPAQNPDAVKIERLTHEDALAKNLKVMDSTAFSMCMDNNIDIVVFELLEPGNLAKCVAGEPIGSTVTKGE